MSVAISEPINPYEKPGDSTIPPLPKTNPFDTDLVLQSILQRILPPSTYNQISKSLHNLSENCIEKYNQLALECSLFPPKLEKYDYSGSNINKLITNPAWKEQKTIAAKEGVISLGYLSQKENLKIEKKYWRIFQMSKLFYWIQYSGLYSCPTAMTDGCAKVLSQLNLNELKLNHEQKLLLKYFYNGLITRNEKEFITSGQWMTERGGGSDVSVNGTRTIAKLQSDGYYRLWGYKWFSSASDADISLALARIEDEKNGNKLIQGTKGVSCFLVINTKKENNIFMEQLKDKLGTRQLPTAELELKGAKAILISKPGEGVKTIVKMANITRIHNAISAAGNIKQSLDKARKFANNRTVFEKKLMDIPLHQNTLATIDICYRASILFVMDCIRLLGLSESQSGTKDELLLRFLTPMVKLYTAKAAVSTVSECIECLGGIGYLETSGLPQIYRDAQVLPVWEGTTNILSLDVLRVLQHKQVGKKAWKIFNDRIKECFDVYENEETDYISKELDVISLFIKTYISNNDVMELLARDLAFSLSRVYIAALMVEQYRFNKDNATKVALEKFIDASMQGYYFSGGKGLVAESIRKAATNGFDYGSEISAVRYLATGLKSKL